MKHMNVETLLDITDNAEREGRVDRFNPYRPYGEMFRLAVEEVANASASTGMPPNEQADLLSVWLRTQYEPYMHYGVSPSTPERTKTSLMLEVAKKHGLIVVDLPFAEVADIRGLPTG